MAVGNHTLPTELLRTCTDGLFSCISQWANEVTRGLFWVFALLAFSIILFMATTRLGNVRAFGYGSFVGMLGAIWLAVMGLMAWWIASAFILTGIVGLAMMVLNEK